MPPKPTGWIRPRCDHVCSLFYRTSPPPRPHVENGVGHGGNMEVGPKQNAAMVAFGDIGELFRLRTLLSAGGRSWTER